MKRQKQNAGTKCKLKDQSMSMKIADLEKVLKCHQAENTEIYNVTQYNWITLFLKLQILQACFT